MFIVCGVLYAIDSVTERNTRIHLALDLYRGHLLNDVSLSFTNPFKNTTMALYNPETKVFFLLLFNHLMFSMHDSSQVGSTLTAMMHNVKKN